MATQLSPPPDDHEIPEPPAGLSDTGRQDWAAFWRSPLAQLVAPSDMPALLRLFAYRDQHTAVWRSLRRQRTVKGSQGQQVLNPQARLLAQLEHDIAALETQFGMTPAAQARLGVALAKPKQEPLGGWIDGAAERRDALRSRMRAVDDSHPSDPHRDLKALLRDDPRERIRRARDDVS